MIPQRYRNIANDPVAHSERMTNVIDNWITGLNSGYANKEKYVEMLDSYCSRDEEYSKDMEEIESDFYADEEDFTSHRSDWSARKRHVEGRPKGWLTRFVSDSSRVRRDQQVASSPPLSDAVVITLKEPVKPRINDLKNMELFRDSTLQSNFCLTCWNLVTIGPTRVCCEHCPVVIHRYCISNLADYFVDDPAPTPTPHCEL